MYSLQIERLEWVVKNWKLVGEEVPEAEYSFYENFNIDLYFECGLCINCCLDYLPKPIVESMFRTFPKFSGDLFLPLSDFENYPSIHNFAQTPERLELAIHCLDFLKRKSNEI